MIRRAACLAIALSATIAFAATAEPPSQAAKDIARAANTFAADLYNLLKDEKKGKNVFFSPYSISTAVAMTHAGAKGKTAAEIQAVLHLEGGQDQILGGYAGLTGYLNSVAKDGDFALSVANAFYGQQGYGFQNDYITTLQNKFSANLFEVDFKGAADQSRQQINLWVAKQTNEKIKDVMPPRSVTDDTRLVLVNAIYFKGKWRSTFNAHATKDETFHLAGNKTTKAPLMYQKARFQHAEGDGFKMLSLRYEGRGLSMVVLLPDENDGLPALEKKLSGEALFSWLVKLDTATYAEVRVYLPKFTTTSQFSLKDSLSKLGMPTAFTDRADFSGINGRTDLFIQAAIHEAFVDVNETGTEAAAATGISAGPVSVPRDQPLLFRADHPFLFMIRDKATGAVLFMGRVMNPAE